MDNLQSLLEVGINSTFDPTKLSKSTLVSSLSHINTLKRNHISLDESTLAYNTVELLDKLKDTSGKPLTAAYKRQIGMTIKRMFPERLINLEKYNRERSKTRRPNTRLASENVVESIKQMIDRASQIIQNVYNLVEITDLAIYDACLCILLSISTSLRINEIHQMKLSHFVRIQNSEPIDIVSKTNRNSRIVTPNNMLLSTFKAIIAQRSKVRQTLVLKKTEFSSQLHIKRYNQGFVIINSIDYLRKKLKELSASLLIKEQSLGFNIFRKYITSELVEGGGHLVAQSMNNHSSLNTTLTHYNVVGPQAVQNTYNDLFGKIDAMTTKVPIDTPEQIKAKLMQEVLMEREMRKGLQENASFNQNANSIIDQQSTLPINENILIPTTATPTTAAEVSTIQNIFKNPTTSNQFAMDSNVTKIDDNKNQALIDDSMASSSSSSKNAVVAAKETTIEQLKAQVNILNSRLDEKNKQIESIENIYMDNRRQFETFIEDIDAEIEDEVRDQTRSLPTFSTNTGRAAADNSLLTPENTRFSFQVGKPTNYLP